VNFYSTHYRNGEEIRSGDRISWAGKPGRVLFVIGSSGAAANLIKDWGLESSEGFMLDTEIAGLVFELESDEGLEFLGRGTESD